MSKEFFKSVQERLASIAITKLRNENSTIVHHRPKLERLSVAFYSSLYNQQLGSDAFETKKQSILQLIQLKFSAEGIHSLSQPFSLSEFKDAIDNMENDKSPERDGYILEFYSKFWDLIYQDFLCMAHGSFTYNNDNVFYY